MSSMKKYIPYIVAFLSFLAVSMVYFAPQYAGKDVRKSDDIQYNGMKGGISEHIEKYGEHPQWASNMFSGMPAYLIDMDYDGRYVKSIADQFYFIGKPAAYYFILMAGFYFMLLCFGVSPYLAIVGSIAYGLSTYFVIIYEAGHITKLMALAYVAPMIGAIFLTFRRNMWLGLGLTGIFSAIEISTSHPQITYYFLFVILGLVIFEGFNYYKQKLFSKFLIRCALLLTVAALAVGANSVQLWYINDYSNDSIRGKSELKLADDNSHNHTSGLDRDYITAWSYGKGETFNMFIPNLMGGSSMGGFSKDGEVAKSLKKYDAVDAAQSLPCYWGDQPFTSGAVYIGAVMVFLFVFGLFLVKGWVKWWIVGVSLLALFLAWGRHMMWFTDLFIDYVPLYNKFRTVSTILVVIQWSVPLLGMLALQKVYNKEIDTAQFNRALKRSLIVVGSIALFFILLGGAVMDFSSDADGRIGLPDDVIAAMQSERADMMRGDAIRSLIFVLIAAYLVFAMQREKIKRGVVVLLLSTLVTVDMIGVDLRFLNYDHFVPVNKSVEITPTAADIEILKDTDPNYRVANLSVSPFQDAQTSYFHKSIGGYHAAKMRRYQDVIDRYLSKMYMGVYNMLNTKYFITKNDKGELGVQYNSEAFGNCWFVDSIEYVKSADQEIDALENVNLRKIAVVDERFKSQLENVNLSAADSSAYIKLESYKINDLVYKSSSTKEQVAIFSEIYYSKGWTAYIDGVESPYFRADYILRGIVIPEGEHTIEFKFAAPNFALFKGITAGSSIVILLIFGVSVVLILIKNKRDRSEEGK